jgi:ubiquinone/menaquinone biosynthesis C-methylase UbiE
MGSCALQSFRRYRSERFELILTRLTIRPDDTIVDLGCGNGENTIEIAWRASSGHAMEVDSSSAMIARAEALRDKGGAGGPRSAQFRRGRPSRLHRRSRILSRLFECGAAVFLNL